jgi:serine/threonine protein phosphatase PrpC
MGPGRDHNSDWISIKLGDRISSYVVADGVGAMPGSPTASQAAAKAAAAWITGRPQVLEADVAALMLEVDRAVTDALQNADAAGATTIAALAVSGAKGLLVTVGDSEAIAVHASGPAERLNPLDHLPNRPNVLTAWLDGKEPYTPHIIPIDAMPYRLLLTTDGVSGVLGDIDIANIVRSVEPGEAAERLVRKARDAGSHDDASCIVIASTAPPEAGDSVFSRLGSILSGRRKRPAPKR